MNKFIFIICIIIIGCNFQHKTINKNCTFINDYKFLKCYHDKINYAVQNNIINDDYYNIILCDCHKEYFKD